MAKALNRVQIIGNLGQDPEVRSTPSGSSVCNISVATTESYKDKNSGEWKDVTEWHRIVLWEGLADTAQRFLRKGSKVFIEGKLQTRSYEKDGITRYITEIRAQSMIMLDGRQESSQSYDQGRQAAPANTGGGDHFAEDSNEDEVPF